MNAQHDFNCQYATRDESEPAYQYKTHTGKMAYGYRITATDYETAKSRIPGDFLVVWHSSDNDVHTIDI
ncbi:hypothetical protein LCGC14_2079860, partial [marine sediment metagenome]